MKKILALALAVVMTMAFATVASAAEVSSGSADVSVVYQNASGEIIAAPAVYSVVIDLEAQTLEYKESSTTDGSMTWNPANHTYEKTESTEVEFLTPGAIVGAFSVTNHSNATVNVAAYFADNSEGKSITTNGVTVTISDNDCTLESAAEVAYDNYDAADSVSYDLTPSGTPENLYNFTVGTIVVVVSHD